MKRPLDMFSVLLAIAVGSGWANITAWLVTLRCGCELGWQLRLLAIGTMSTCHLLLTTSLWADLRSAWGWRSRQHRVWRDTRRRNAHKPRTF